jgi:hypothetical protein
LPPLRSGKTRTARTPPPLTVLKAAAAELAHRNSYRLAVAHSISDKAMRRHWNQDLGPYSWIVKIWVPLAMPVKEKTQEKAAKLLISLKH